MTYAPQEQKNASQAARASKSAQERSPKKPQRRRVELGCAAPSKVRYSEAVAYLAASTRSLSGFGYKVVRERLFARIVAADDVIQVAELIVTLKHLAGESTSDAELILRLIDASMKAHIIDITDELPSGLRKALGDLPGHYESYIEHVEERGFPTCDSQTAWNAAFWSEAEQEATSVYHANCHWMVDLLLSGKRPTQVDEGASINSSVQGRGPHGIVAPDKVQIGDIAAFLTGVSVRADSGGDTIPVGAVIHVGLVIRVSGAGTDDIQVLEKMDPRQPINTRTVAEILNDSIAQRATVIFLRPRSGSQAP